ncbi:MAG: DUF1553 domain-containing protein [Planctomycetia bacterium]|nr:DUF1553 domain-containing protein [Planctomycetia bacterium]
MNRILLIALPTLLAFANPGLGAETAAPLPVGQGEVQSLSIWPEKVVLRSADQFQQLLVTAHHANGGLRDVTAQASYRASDTRLIRVDAQGMLFPLANGVTELAAEFQGKTVKLAVTVEGAERERPIHFANEVMPILTKFGCNTGACHGKAEGQNGFKLSLLGFDPEADYVALAREDRGRRTMATAPERSLLLLKATGRLGHGGGKLLPPEGVEYQVLNRWIAGGLPEGGKDDPKVVGITVTPPQRSLVRQASQQLTVTARYSDGSSTDVTSRAEFVSNEEQLASVTRTGRVETRDRSGEAAIMVRYLGQVGVFRAAIPQDLPADKITKHTPNNYIDQHVFARLRELGIPAADVCSDGEFLRRVSLDITGTLPTVAEAEKFLADRTPDKRAKLVDDLLTRPAYASYFALKWGDILRLRGGGRNAKKDDNAANKGPVLDTEAQRADAFHAWIKQSLAENKPYDRFVREVITAEGVTSGPETAAPIVWYLELKTPQGLVDDMAQAFLGTRIQCARCHHHPFEKWTQDDYWGLAMYFGRLQWQSRGRDPKSQGDFMPVRLGEGARLGQKVTFDPKLTLTSPRGKEYLRPKPLDGAEVALEPTDDPRHKLVDWMAQADNPFFARTLVNRYWGHFFGRGIVDPIDDLRVTNPPCYPGLLDALAKDFIEHQFDLKHVIRTICNSKTYQLSSTANEWNRSDKQNFSRYAMRRLPAEVLLDAIDQVTGSPTEFTAMGGLKFPAGTRAIDLADIHVSSYFLEVFGKSKRQSACECERDPTITLAQRAHLLNNTAVRGKLVVRAAQLVADKRTDAEKVREVYLAFFTREPTAEERRTIEQYFAGKGGAEAAKTQVYHDLLWALLNTKEFVFTR